LTVDDAVSDATKSYWVDTCGGKRSLHEMTWKCCSTFFITDSFPKMRIEGKYSSRWQIHTVSVCRTDGGLQNQCAPEAHKEKEKEGGESGKLHSLIRAWCS
jgi:hypothetical protein